METLFVQGSSSLLTKERANWGITCMKESSTLCVCARKTGTYIWARASLVKRSVEFPFWSAYAATNASYLQRYFLHNCAETYFSPPIRHSDGVIHAIRWKIYSLRSRSAWQMFAIYPFALQIHEPIPPSIFNSARRSSSRGTPSRFNCKLFCTLFCVELYQRS